MKNVVNVRFVSIWNNNIRIESDAKYDTQTKRVFDIEVADCDNIIHELDILEKEIIEIKDGSKLEVELNIDGEYYVL